MSTPDPDINFRDTAIAIVVSAQHLAALSAVDPGTPVQDDAANGALIRAITDAILASVVSAERPGLILAGAASVARAARTATRWLTAIRLAASDRPAARDASHLAAVDAYLATPDADENTAALVAHDAAALTAIGATSDDLATYAETHLAVLSDDATERATNVPDTESHHRAYVAGSYARGIPLSS